MDDYSRSHGGRGMEMERYYGQHRPPPSYDLRSYSTSASSAQTQMGNKDSKFKKGRSASSSSSSSSNSWNFSDPEFQRKKRVANYKMYSVEGQMKGSFRKSFRWFKDKYTRIVYGWW